MKLRRKEKISNKVNKLLNKKLLKNSGNHF